MTIKTYTLITSESSMSHHYDFQHKRSRQYLILQNHVTILSHLGHNYYEWWLFSTFESENFV